jgi:transposase-like protein
MTARNTCPPHYSYSNIQPWDVIDAWGLDYYLGNVLKYICRAGKKEPERLVDLNKALHYLRKAVELEEVKLEKSSRLPDKLRHSDTKCLHCGAEGNFVGMEKFCNVEIPIFHCPVCERDYTIMTGKYDEDENSIGDTTMVWPEISCRKCQEEMEPVAYNSENKEMTYLCNACRKTVVNVRLCDCE